MTTPKRNLGHKLAQLTNLNLALCSVTFTGRLFITAATNSLHDTFNILLLQLGVAKFNRLGSELYSFMILQINLELLG